MSIITKRMMAQESGANAYLFKGTQKIAGFAAVPLTGWSIAVTQNKDEFMGAVNQMIKYNIIVGIIVLVIVGLLIFVVALQIIRPINDAVE
ncbi:MAG: methyl-accepting chemotaxis protein, partial [Desulfobacteraceae bacterium]|nr:methyl-accepting chemotaxis protein [Desulfobacteraceae bacterium]